MQLERLSAAEIGNLVNARQISPVEVVKYFKKRIIDRNSDINAFVYTKFDEAEKQARDLEKRLKTDFIWTPFTGVPFGLKDFLPNKPGWTNSHGGVECLITTDTIYSEFCKAMEKAGGIAIGKTNAPAYGFRGTTDNKLYGPTSTPFKVGYNSGGSSGGSAAAVADGLVPIAEGGDAGGSIRIPAAWCNLFGFKPGIGTVPSVCRPDAWAATHPFCFNGGLTKTVEDAAILLDYMSYFDPRDPFSRERFPFLDYQQESRKPIRGTAWKVALTYDFNFFEVDTEIRETITRIAHLLEEEGIQVDLVDFHFGYSLQEIAEMWCHALMFDSVIEIETDKANGRDYLKEHPEQFPKELMYWEEKCKNSTIWDLYKFNLVRTDILDQFENIFTDYDFIISPTACCLPVPNAIDGDTKGPTRINGKEVDPLIGWSETYLVNFVGNPAASVPVGLSKEDKLPIGMQVIGRRFHDIDVLRLSRLLEEINPWRNNFNIPFTRKIGEKA